MDTPSSSVTGQPFSVHAPLRQPIVILHIVLVAMASLGCFPIALIQGARNHRKSQFYTLAAGSICALLGLVAGGAIQLTDTPTFARTMLNVIGYILLFLIIVQAGLALYQRQKSDLQTHMILGWTVLVLTYTYLLVAALVFTESCSHQVSGQCLLPLAMGSGFLAYGSLALLHLLNILSLPRSSTPEYYEGLIITLWGVVCVCTADTPILGADWRAFNLGLLWCAGGVFSVALSLQTWMPAIRERNIVNAIIICLTGRAVIAKYTQNDPYGAQVHSVLGYLLIFASIARVGQVMFRKSPSDNLPGLLAQTSETVVSAEAIANGIDGDDDEERQSIYQMTYQRLTGQAPPASTCRHASVFASITVVCGLLGSFLFMAAGILFMGANVQWVGHVRYYISDPATYINVTMAVSFLWATYVFVLCNIFKSLRPFSQSYYEYLGMSDMEAATPASPIAMDQYDQSSSPPSSRQHHHHRSSLPLRRGVEEPPAMRPSQYRAKRRSLLVQSPQQQHHYHHHQQHDSTGAKKQRTRSSSSFNGVGGVLPDQIIIDPASRRSWLSNGSATSTGSAASFASAGSSAASSIAAGGGGGNPATTLSSSSSSPSARRTTVLFSEEEELRQTESGRRKQQQQQRQQDDEEEGDSVASAKYFERNSSDSHVC